MTALDAQAGLGYTCLAHRCALPILNFPKLLVTIERKSRLSGYHQPFQVAAVPPPHTPPRLQPCQAAPGRRRCSSQKQSPEPPRELGKHVEAALGHLGGGGPQTQRLENICKTPECSSNKAKESYTFYSQGTRTVISFHTKNISEQTREGSRTAWCRNPRKISPALQGKGN